MAGMIKLYVDDENCIFDEDISIRLVKCGRERCLSDKKEEGGNRVYYSLHYVVRGEGYIDFCENSFGVSPVLNLNTLKKYV